MDLCRSDMYFELLWIYGFNAAESWPHFILIALIIVADFYFWKSLRNHSDRNGLRNIFGRRHRLHGAYGYTDI